MEELKPGSVLKTAPLGRLNPLIQPKKGKTGSLLQDDFYNGDENKMVKKLNHSANERHRRQKINTLYSTLKSLLPPQDQSRKLSIPATLSRVLKYIPELKKEVERLSKNKETLISSSKINSNVEKDHSPSFGLNNKRIKLIPNSLSTVVSATPISDREIVMQISMPKAQKRTSLSEAVMRLEQEGFLTVNATCFESFDARVFYNLHLQAQGNQVLMDAEMLEEKMWPL
ncbi:hypothetical protein DH2020_016592 [Rehmannia glutinosa]|uniref:BHLH domain-containing protein n=1 Tax=Rehmannia glutinosa TaxID=99300 RepID=A0ABR0WRW9_REHGL